MSSVTMTLSRGRRLEKAAPAPAAGGFPSHHPAWLSRREPALCSPGPFQVP